MFSLPSGYGAATGTTISANGSICRPNCCRKYKKIGTLSGTDFSGQYLVAEAASEDALLLKNAELRRTLDPLIKQGKLKDIQSLDQFILPAAEQNRLKQHLRNIADKPGNYRAMYELGIPEDTLKSALLQAADTPAITLSDGIALPSGAGLETPVSRRSRTAVAMPPLSV